MQRTGTSLLIRVSVLASVVVMVAAGIVGVVLVRAGDEPEAHGLAAPAVSPSASTSDSVPVCLLGSWTVTRATSNEILDDDLVEFVSEDPVRWRFNADGTGEYDQGAGATYAHGDQGNRVTLVYKGKVTFSFKRTAGGIILDNVHEDNTGTVVSISGRSVWVPVQVPSHFLAYRCTGDTLSLGNEVRSFELRRA